ncbi:vegetative incompatibility protein HET-E-1 [Rhizoctonia solani AG-3 Rhs1AP]|uniref:Vegetative incompatibility protein HET-E-1 n=2 Tax=Rhizoctonia solani AG-3 TaxID=1086053 RepID=A0A074RVK3_9AGAM|nr:vegetative incompatibility protein HET-E-1 [Rhizoctonia solani AG-3 Rhs1AP]KEP48658.1 vegetative incompatibility protein HET-E-1 [Rhizoctonia solani 123E]
MPSGTKDRPVKGGLAWSGLKTLLQILESSSDAFGPLKSAISGLNKCIDIYERASKGRKDYDELREKLQGLLTDLAGHITHPMDSMMTNSVKLLCCGIEEEIKKVVEKQGRNAGQQLFEAMDTSEEILECYRRINGLVQRLAEARLKGIAPAMSAIYDSTESDDIKRGGCTPGTRQPQIDLLLEWAHDPDAGRTCWMNGMAGTGKTTIAYSVCTNLEQASALGASFFCSRVIPECRQVKHIIPTIAYQLARYSLPFRCALDKVLELYPDARSRTLKIQYQKLLVEPLVQVQASVPSDFIVVIDALDECENEESLGQILDLLLSPTSVLPIRFFVSSRPEPEINRRMTELIGKQDRRQLVLHDLNADGVKSDIEAYMRHELEHVPLADLQWSGLIDRCGVLFIYASTVCRLVKQGHQTRTLNEAISVIVDSTPSSAHEDEPVIDELYSIILTTTFDKAKMRQGDIRRTRGMLDTVVCAIEPMTLDALVSVLELECVEQANALLQPLRSVLNVTSAGLVTTLHASFPDFLLSAARSGSFHCVSTRRHTTLTESCFRLIKATKPQFNICGLASSYLADDEVTDIDERVRRSISVGLVYACRYWSTHLCLGDYNEIMVDVVRSFFCDRLLLWMEILNLTKNIRFGASNIRKVEQWCLVSVSKDLIRVVRDGEQFVSVYANHPISQSTPHIYVSMLAFWPRTRPISIAYMPRTTGILHPSGTAIARRQPALLATWRLSEEIVSSISLSSDGSRIVAATQDAVELIDTSTGDRVLQKADTQTEGVQAVALSPDGANIAFGGNSGVYMLDVKNETIQEVLKPSSTVLSTVFSPDGSQFACGPSDGDTHIYTSRKGDQVVDPLKVHTGYINSVRFSPDGCFLASGSDDSSIKIWNVKTGHMMGSPLRGHTRSVFSVSYSPDGTRLASASDDGTIRVWDLIMGQIALGPLTEHSGPVGCVAFSPDGAYIASGSHDMTIRVYNSHTGQTVLGPLEAHTDWVSSIIFSPDCTQLFSGSHDGTVRLWNIQDLDTPSSLQPTFPQNFYSARYSPDGLLVVSGSYDGNVCVWNVLTGEMVLGPLSGHSRPVVAVDYSPNSAYIASASRDSTLRIWSAQDGRDLYGPIQGHTKEVNCVRFSPDGTLLVSGSDDSTVRVWDVSRGQCVIEPLRGHSGPVYSVAFSPNGASVVSGSYDRTTRVWDIKTGQTVIGPLQGHKDRVSSVEFSPGGSQILSGSWCGTIRTWDAQNGQPLLV